MSTAAPALRPGDTLALTGATGIVGRFVEAMAAAEGWRVRALARPASDRTGFAGPVQWIDGSVDDPAAQAALIDGAQALVHAGFAHLPGRYRGGEGDDPLGFIDTNLGASLALLERARAAGVARAVVLSSRAVIARRVPGRSAAGTVDEDHPTNPDTRYGAVKAALEAFVQAWGQGAAGAPWCVAGLRATGVYGLVHPARRTKWRDGIAAIAQGQPWPLVRGGTEVHGADLADAVRLLLSAPAAQVAGRVFNLSDLYVTSRDVALIVQRLTGATGPLPDTPATLPQVVLATDRIEALGLRLGGWPRLEATVTQILDSLGTSDHTRRNGTP
ncbi:hypothetical protein CCR80_02890 [Rhodothalassium salexigens]|uniref:NAD-dependent epimerase/dehydratase family protein n=1 Tax=Rhodothalassium salexigens TaxID=1086 RepID=UPI001914218C|nr:NAD(P)-dependent oxidoreductase [Rhodothalassium salexigens]MBK5919985.1 hypothetical protein [Rhodothalassium salexigens]